MRSAAFLGRTPLYISLSHSCDSIVKSASKNTSMNTMNNGARRGLSVLVDKSRMLLGGAGRAVGACSEEGSGGVLGLNSAPDCWARHLV